MDPKIIKDAVKAITNACMHKGTNKNLTTEDIAKLTEFNKLVKSKSVTLEHCKEVFKICKDARQRGKGKINV